jgi:hypothetical protein
MVNKAILAGELPSAAARAAAAASPSYSGFITVRSSAGSAPVYTHAMLGQCRCSMVRECRREVDQLFNIAWCYTNNVTYIHLHHGNANSYTQGN